MVSPKLASVLKKAQSLGRRGDTILAHINPYEAKVLKSLGGSGSINPHTGLPEFAGADPSGSSVTSSNYSGGSSSGSSLSGFTGGGSSPSGVSGGGFSTSGGGSYSSTGGGGWTSTGGGGGGGSIAAARTADRQSVAGYSADPVSSNAFSGNGSNRSVTMSTPSFMTGASGLANALSAGAGKVANVASSFSDTLSGIFSNAQPSINSLGNRVADNMISMSDALNANLNNGYNYARDYINNALSPSASQAPSYTQMAALSGPQGLGEGVDAAISNPPVSSNASPSPDWADPSGYIGGSRLVGYEGSGNTVYSNFGNINDTPAPTRAAMREFLDRQNANIPAATARPSSTAMTGYSGPKGVNAPVNGVIPHLNQAAYEAGGGLTLDPAEVARISGRLGYTPIGLKTNNPGNIFDGKWAQSQPGYIGPTTSRNGLTYATFASPEYGVNAVEALISGPTYYGAGRVTINDIINRYAPVDENNSAAANAAYKNYIASQLGVSKDTTLTQDQLGQMALAQVAFENGGNPLVRASPATSVGYNIPDSGLQQVTSANVEQPFPTTYEVDANKLVSDIRAKNWGSGIYSDQGLIDKVVGSNPDAISYDANSGKLTVQLGDANGDGSIDQQDYNSVLASFKEQASVDPSGYTVPLSPPTQTNVAANPIMANMGIIQPPESPDIIAPTAVAASQAPARFVPNRPVTPTPETAYGSMVDPNVYASPLTLPAQPNTVLSKAINTVVGLTPLGLPNTIAGLFGYGIGDQIANADNIPMTVDEAQAAQERMFASSQGGNGRDTQVSTNTKDVVRSAKTKAKATNTRWKLDALAWGFSEEQLADREVSDLIKQVYDLGFIPKTA